MIRHTDVDVKNQARDRADLWLGSGQYLTDKLSDWLGRDEPQNGYVLAYVLTCVVLVCLIILEI